MARAIGGTERPCHNAMAERSTLIKAQFSALNMATERGTSDETEAAHQRVHDQRIRLEAANSNRIYISVTIKET